jgi:hypothetical protein
MWGLILSDSHIVPEDEWEWKKPAWINSAGSIANIVVLVELVDIAVEMPTVEHWTETIAADDLASDEHNVERIRMERAPWPFVDWCVRFRWSHSDWRCPQVWQCPSQSLEMLRCSACMSLKSGSYPDSIHHWNFVVQSGVMLHGSHCDMQFVVLEWKVQMWLSHHTVVADISWQTDYRSASMIQLSSLHVALVAKPGSVSGCALGNDSNLADPKHGEIQGVPLGRIS